MEEKKEKKGFKIFAGIMLSVLALALAGSIVLNFFTMNSVTGLRKSVKILQEDLHDLMREKELEDNTETREDDVLIADEYWIRSTTHMSDAYKDDDLSKLTDKEKEAVEIASDVIKEVIEDGMSDYEKEYAIYNWMCDNLSFDNESTVAVNSVKGDNPYDVLKYHKCVCVGYATTFRMFMQMLDIECKVVHNSECYHSWDLVKIEGDWYHVDVYGGANGGRSGNFNVNDDMRRQEQNWDMEYFPSAASLACNPVYKERASLDSTDKLLEVVDSYFKAKSDGFAIEITNMDEMDKATTMMDILYTMFMNQQVAVAGYPYYIEVNPIYEEESIIYMVSVSGYYENPDYPDYPDNPDDPDYPTYDYEEILQLIKDYYEPLGFDNFENNYWDGEW